MPVIQEQYVEPESSEQRFR